MELTTRELEIVADLIEFMQRYHVTSEEEDNLLEESKQHKDNNLWLSLYV